MEINALPTYDMSDNPTGCCPRFNPQGWDDQDLHFVDKPFVKARTWSIFHIPMNFGSVFKKTFEAIEKADAHDETNFIVLSRDLSPWSSEHYFSVKRDVAGQTMTHMSGDFLTKVFEGPYRNAPKWEAEMREFAANHGQEAERVFFFYTTCPKCAKYYGKNYLVAVAKVHDH